MVYQTQITLTAKQKNWFLTEDGSPTSRFNWSMRHYLTDGWTDESSSNCDSPDHAIHCITPDYIHGWFHQAWTSPGKGFGKALNTRHPAQSMGILVQNNLTGLIWHCKDVNRQGLPLDPNDLVEDNLIDGHLAYEAYVQNQDKGLTSKPSRSGVKRSISTIGTRRSLRHSHWYMGVITACLPMWLGPISHRDGIPRLMP